MFLSYKGINKYFSPINTLTLLFILQIPFKYIVLSNSEAGFLIEKYDGAIILGLKFLCLYFFITLVSYKIFQNINKKTSNKYYSISNLSKVKHFSILLPIFILLIAIFDNGLNVFFKPIILRSYWEKGGMAYISQFYQFATIISLYLMYKNKTKRLNIIAFFLFHFLNSLIISRVGWIINFFIVIVFLRNIFLNKSSIIQIGISSIVIPFFGVFSLIYRRITIDSNLNINDVFEIFYTSLYDFFFSFAEKIVRRFDQLEHFSNLMHSIYYDKLSTSPFFPFSVFVQFIPRSFWPNKPENFSTTMTRHFDLRVIEVGATNNYLGVGEFVFIFGSFGVVLCGIFTGYMYSKLNKYWTICKIDASAFPIMISLFMYIWIGMSSGFLNDWSIPMLAINSILLLLFSRIVIRKI